VSGIGEQRRGVRGEAVAGFDDDERSIQADPDEERTAEVHGVNVTAMTVRALMIAFMMRVIVMELIIMMVVAIHAPSLASAVGSGDRSQASSSR
jgi:hypothetical protein